MRMTGPDGRASLLAVHATDALGRSVLESMLGERPFSEVRRVAALDAVHADPRGDLRDVLLAGLADVMEQDQEDPEPGVGVSWDEGPVVTCSRSDASRPWPIATEGMRRMLTTIGPRHRLIPSILLPALGGMLPGEPVRHWPNEDGLVLSSEAFVQADLSDPLERLRTMAACAKARLSTGAEHGSMIRAGSPQDAQR